MYADIIPNDSATIFCRFADPSNFLFFKKDESCFIFSIYIKVPSQDVENNRLYLFKKIEHKIIMTDQFEAFGDPFLEYAPSQAFRFGDQTQSLQAQCRAALAARLAALSPDTRPCPCCGTILLGLDPSTVRSSLNYDHVGERNGWCCAFNDRRHIPWPPFPVQQCGREFTQYARVINTLLSPCIIHGPPGEGLQHRNLTYHASVMTVNGMLYAKMMRHPTCCWFIHDSSYDPLLRKLLKTRRSRDLLETCRRILLESSSLAHMIRNDEVPGEHAGDNDPTYHLIVDEETRMCSVYISPAHLPVAPTRYATILGSYEAIPEMSSLWELLCYPLMHFTGNDSYAWSPGMLSWNGKSILSLLDYLKSVILTQPGFWRYGRLAEQFVLDTWARQEQHEVEMWKSETVQRRLRSYAKACGRATPPGKIFLPQSVPFSYPYMRRFFHDALHISRCRGNGHLFITMTCNPAWAEVKALLGKESFDIKKDAHQAILARVFVHKRKQLIARLKQRNYLFAGHLGLDWIVLTTEWQKGDLPHAHMAVRLLIDTSICPMNTQLDHLKLMDHIISARIPAPSEAHYEHVIAYMQHGQVCKGCLKEFPKGSGNMRCRFRFPKPVNPESRIDSKGFPVYRRGEHDVRIVPHNPRLLIDFCCHINIEWTMHSQVLAYLYKYMCKGPDTAGAKLRDSIDEIAAFRKLRYLSVGEAVYRSLCFCINIREPSVVVCPIHLPRKDVGDHDEDFGAVFDNHDNFADTDQFAHFEESGYNIAAHEQRNHGPDYEYTHDYLLHYFDADRPDNMLFCEYYENYIRIGRGHSRSWVKRQRTILARMPWYPPYAGEIFYLRVLLLHIPARSYSELLGNHSSLKAHALSLGLIPNSDEYRYGMIDAVESGQAPSTCRHLLALFLTCPDVPSLKDLWDDERIRQYLTYDYRPSDPDDIPAAAEIADIITLMDIATMVYDINPIALIDCFRSRDLPQPPNANELVEIQARVHKDYEKVFKEYSAIVGYKPETKEIVPREAREIHRYRQRVTILPQPDLDEQFTQLNNDQAAVFCQIRSAFENRNVPGNHNLHNIDASAGCGKTFLTNRLINAFRSMGAVTATVCSIGIGALLYDDGRTVHNMFQIPIRADHDVLEGLKITSRLMKIVDDGKTNSRIEFLRAMDALFWDEISTIDKEVFHSVDHLLRRIMNNDKPFGGKFVVTLGDWKQIPPVDDTEGVRFWNGDQETFASIINVSVKSTHLYRQSFCKSTLTINERARNDPPFHRFNFQCGIGVLDGDIPIKFLIDLGVRLFTTVEESCAWLFEQDIIHPYDPITVSVRCILSPYNRNVDMLNEYCETKFHAFHTGIGQFVLKSADEFICKGNDAQGPHGGSFIPESEDARVRNDEYARLQNDINEYGVYEGTDNDDNDQQIDVEEAISRVRLDEESFSIEHINAMNFKGVPPHCLRLYIGCVMILLRNLDTGKRLQNGVRLILRNVLKGNRILVVVKADEEREYRLKGSTTLRPKEFLLHRIKFECRMGPNQDATVTRKQFPVRLANAVSIHKSQSMTLERHVVDMRDGVFEHGQFFVAMTRGTMAKQTGVLIREGQETVRNIVIKSFIEI